MGAKSKNLVGEKFGQWIVIELVRFRRNPGEAKIRAWRCLCSCGQYGNVTGWSLRNGTSRSCGCKKYPTGRDHPRWLGTRDISGGYFIGTKHGAESRGIGFSITIEDMQRQFDLQDRRCALSGIKIEAYEDDDSARTASLDRIDSSKGYTSDNIQWVHKDINRMKNDLDQSNFITKCKAITNKQRQEERSLLDLESGIYEQEEG